MGTDTKSLTPLPMLAQECRGYLTNAAMNMLQVGRCLTEAKSQLAHGEWAGWLEENVLLSARTAQQYMQAWAKFGKDPKYGQLGQSQLIKLLSTTEEERETLFREGEVEKMSVREMDAKIREIREEARREAQAEAQTAIRQAEARAEAAIQAAREEPETPTLQRELQAVQERAEEYRSRVSELTDQLKKYDADLRDALNDLNESEQEKEAARRELQSLRSAQARGDAARAEPDGLTLDTFGRAVREFIGVASVMPHMQTAFGGMSQSEKAEWLALLNTVDGWARGARQALETHYVEGGASVV